LLVKKQKDTMPSMQIDLNCDMGEWLAGSPGGTAPQAASDHAVSTVNDALIMPYISSANISCGFHAGDPLAIEKTICLAIGNGVAVGAHPGYPDPEGFGRRAMDLPADQLRAVLLYQVGAIKSMTESLGGVLRHVKPHGALYNAAASDYKIAKLVALTIRDVDPSLVLYGLSGSEMAHAAAQAGLAFASEVFADRAYQDNGQLVPRSMPGAVLDDPEEMITRVVRMVSEGLVLSSNGKEVPVEPGTICIHGDNPSAPAFVKQLSERLKAAGIRVQPRKTHQGGQEKK
jgi:5-oxoprolinase (ATP-hydrolysing) subunit A